MPLTKEADRLRKRRQRAAARDRLVEWAQHPHKCPKCGRTMTHHFQDGNGGVTKGCWERQCLTKIVYDPQGVLELE